MQKARGQAEISLRALPPLVGTGFQVQCPPLIGVLPTVRSPYWVRYRSSSAYLALQDGPRRIQAGFHVPDPTWVPDRRTRASGLRDYHPLWCHFPKGLSARLRSIPRLRPLQLGRCPARLRLIPVRSPLLRESRLISSPPGTEMFFQFPAAASVVFRDRRSLGSSPGLIAAFHARILMTPRHNPRP